MKLKTLSIITFIVAITILLADITNTANVSYGLGVSSKIGQVGWFYSPNEIGSLMGILFPVVFLSLIKKINIYTIFVLILNIYALFVIGTKVAFISIVITLFGVLLFKIFRAIVYKEKIPNYVANISIAVIAFVVVVTPIAPITHNMGIHLTNLKMNSLSDIFEAQSEDVSNLVYYGREDFLTNMMMVWKENNNLQKMFGIGRENIYLGETKVKEYIERDFHDVFYYYGIVGFLLFVIPMFSILFLSIESIFKKFKKKFDLETAILLISVMIGFSAAYIAGHILLSPAVCIYIAITLNMLYFHVDEKQVKE